MTSDQDDAPRRLVAPASVGEGTATEPAGEGVRPGPPAGSSELSAVAEAMAAARAGAASVDGVPSVPSDDEVATLEQAHDTLRTTLDRAERGG